MQFSESLRERRKELGLRQEDVAADAGVSHITYGDYERGKCFPKNTILRMLCNVLKLDYDQMYALMVESRKLSDITKAEQRAKVSEMMIEEPWKQETSTTKLEQQRKPLNLKLQLPSLAITGHLSEDGTIHGQLKTTDVRLFLGEEWETIISAQAPAGRLTEFQHLCYLAKQAQDGRGQVVSIVGTAGIGKSHLLSSLHEYLDHQGFMVVAANCRANADDIPYYPFVILLDALSEDKSLADKWDAELPLLRRLLPPNFQIRQEKRWQHPPLTEEQRQEMLINNLLRALEITTQQCPLAVIMEDAHWMDEASQKLTGLLAERLNTHHIYLMIAYRPQIEGHWVYAPNHTQLWLPPLSEQDSETVLSEQLQPGQLAPEEREWIYRKTNGNPFFAKEMVRELIDDGLLIRRTRWWKFSPEKAPLDAQELGQVLKRRISRIPDNHQPFLKYAATLGSPFSKKQARIAIGESLDASLQVLEESDIVHYESKSGIYSFTHDLTQETAYANIPETERADLHQKVAQSLEESMSETMNLGTYLILADHYLNAGEINKRVTYLRKASVEAHNILLYAEAQSYLQQALELLDPSTEDAEILGLRLEVLEQLDTVIIHTGNHQQRIVYIKEALNLSQKIDAPPQRRASLYHRLIDVYGYLQERTAVIRVAKEGLSLLDSEPPCLEAVHLWHALVLAYRFEGKKTEMWEALKQELTIAASTGNSEGLSLANRQYATILHWEGRLAEAKERYLSAYDLARKADNRHRQCEVAVAFGSCLRDLNDLEEAYKWYEHGLTIAEDIYYWHILLGNIHPFAMVALRIGMPPETVEQKLMGALEITDKIGYAKQEILDFALGRFYCHQQRWTEARQRLEKAIVEFSEMAIGQDLVNALGFLEWSMEKLGEHEVFPTFCNEQLKDVHDSPDIPKQRYLVSESPISRIYNEGKEVFSDQFDDGKLPEHWGFQTGHDDAYYELSESGGIILYAPRWCDIFPMVNMDSPRMVMELSGDFALEVEIENLPKEPLNVGGILLWQDDHHFFRFERGLFGPNELRFGYVCGDDRPRMMRLGRGYLNARSYRLRLERIGTRVRALVNADNNEQWLSCGEYNTPLRDVLSMGFYAICSNVLTEFYPVDSTRAALWVKACRIIVPK